MIETAQSTQNMHGSPPLLLPLRLSTCGAVCALSLQDPMAYLSARGEAYLIIPRHGHADRADMTAKVPVRPYDDTLA